MSDFIPAEDAKEAIKVQLIGSCIRVLELHKRVPEFMRSQGWPAEDKNLLSVIMLAVALKRLGEGSTKIPRPVGADVFGASWPIEAFLATATQICDTLELDYLLTLG